MNRLTRVLQNNAIFYGSLIFIASALSVWIYFFAPVRGSFSTTYNDYLIFKQSFYHLIKHTDLYASYPSEYNDLYKYSPTFALLMAPFAILPNAAGVILWNILNLLVVYYSFKNFVFYNETKKLLAMAFVLAEALTSIYSSQCNCLITGLLIIAFECLENKKPVTATLLLAISVFIKPFALAAFLLLLLYPGKPKAFIFSIIWSILLFALPLLVISPAGLIGEYKSWFLLLKGDHDNSMGYSVMGTLQYWFGSTDKIYTLLIGMLLLLLPLTRYKSFISQSFRRIFFASILIWVVIFNHKAETYTYIIAISGIAIWYFSQPDKKLNLLLLMLALFFTILVPTSIFPWTYHNKYLSPYLMFVIPSLLIWLKISAELLFTNFNLKKLN